jgi:hypothetical protein
MIHQMRPVLGIALVAALSFMTATASSADQPVKDARYRVRHGGKVALTYFDRKGTFERFNSRKAHRLEPNLAWIDHREPTDGAQVDIAFRGERRLLLITRTVAGRWFCTVTTGSGNQTAGGGNSFGSVDTKRGCSKT